MIPPRTPGDEFCDDEGEMRTHQNLDDSTAEAVLRGVVPADRPDLDALVALTAQLHALRSVAPPAPTGQLAQLVHSGLNVGDGKGVLAAGSETGPAPQVSRLPKPKRRLLPKLVTTATARLGAAGLLVKSAAGVSIALASVTGAATADLLPEQVQDRVAAVVEHVSPFDLPDSADQRPEPGPTGTDIADDVKDEQDRGVQDQTTGEGAVDGAKPDTTLSERPEEPGQTGLDKANRGPGSEPAPDSAPLPGDNPAPVPAPRPAEQPAQKPAGQPAQKPAEPQTGQPAQKRSEQPTQQPTHTPAEQQAEQPGERPAEEPAGAGNLSGDSGTAPSETGLESAPVRR
jgi:outer membrane biosynthesis protein TonB